jgi:TPR repeat protein
MPYRKPILLVSLTVSLFATLIGIAASDEYDSLLKKAKAGDVESQSQVGYQLLQKGQVSAALPWLQSAAQKNWPNAQFELGELYYGRLWAEEIQNHSEALKWLYAFLEHKDLADYYRAKAELIIGSIFYQECDIYKHDDKISLYECGKTSKNGSIPKNYDAAARNFKAAANRGDPSAMYQLAQMYQQGHGVLQDFKEAERLYRLAATQYEPPIIRNATFSLAKLKLSLGDRISAHALFNVAALSHHELAGSERDFLTRTMTPPELGAAQKMANEVIQERDATRKQREKQFGVKDAKSNSWLWSIWSIITR